MTAVPTPRPGVEHITWMSLTRLVEQDYHQPSNLFCTLTNQLPKTWSGRKWLLQSHKLTPSLQSTSIFDIQTPVIASNLHPFPSNSREYKAEEQTHVSSIISIRLPLEKHQSLPPSIDKRQAFQTNSANALTRALMIRILIFFLIISVLSLGSCIAHDFFRATSKYTKSTRTPHATLCRSCIPD